MSTLPPAGELAVEVVNPFATMNSLHKPTLFTLALALACALFASGCNTMRGLGQDTERAGEKIQENAK